MAAVQGCIFPCFGIFMTKIMFGLMLDDKEEMKETSQIWSLYMFIMSATALFSTTLYKGSFGMIGENITINIRRELY